MNQCFKIKHGTDYDSAVKKHFRQRPLWKKVMSRIGELLNENVTEMALLADELWVNTNQIANEENRKLFNKNGKLKNNTKRSKEVLEKYKQIVEEEGLSNFKELRVLNFCYGVMRFHGESLESYVTSDNNIYYKADFDLEQRSKGLVTPISEVEYEEKYLEELKRSN